MNHVHKLAPFRHLIKSSFRFYKANWKALLGLLLPIEIAVCALSLILTLGLTPVRFSWIGIFAALLAFALALTKIFKKLTIFAGGMIAHSIEGGEKQALKERYKAILTEAMPIAWVAVLESLYMCAVAAISFVAFAIVFFLPFIVLGLLARVFPSLTDFISVNGGAISVGTLCVCVVGLIVTNIFFMMRVWFSSYTLLIEGKDGIDALAESAMFARGKSWHIFWRMLLIGVISLLPIIIILGPIYSKILIEAAKQMAVAFALGLKPVFPPIALDLLVWRSALALLAGIIWAPIFMVLNYFLWKDVKAAAPVFEESTYTKTRKRIKICIWIGLVITVLFIIGSVFAR